MFELWKVYKIAVASWHGRMYLLILIPNREFFTVSQYMKQYTVQQEMDTDLMLRILAKLPFRSTSTEYLRDQIKCMRDGEVDEVSEKQMGKMLVALVNIVARVDVQGELNRPAILLA